MPAAYVVLSHTPAAQVTRLVRAIMASSGDAHVFVLHDDRNEPAPVRLDSPRVHVRAHGLPTDWGSWELVEAMLEGLRWARSAVDPDLTAVVSGQCYPVRPLTAWEAELRAAGGWQGTARALCYRPRWGRPHGIGDDELTRYTYRWFQAPSLNRLLSSGRLTARAVWALAHRLEPLVTLRIVDRGRGVHVGLRRRSDPEERFYLGSQWLAVDRAHAEALLRQLAEGTPLRRRYERSVIADESAFQTVLARAEPPTREVPVSYSVWEAAEDSTRTLTLADLDDIRASGSPFCRKVHPVASAELLDVLDRTNGSAGADE